MSEQFDPYYEWLGIPPRDQPANHYRLLGIELFEENLNVIEKAADRQMGHVRTFQNGTRSAESQQLLNELSTAKVCLLNDEKKTAYDGALRTEIQAQIAPAASPELPVPVAQPAAPVVFPTPEPAPMVGIASDQQTAAPTVSTHRKRTGQRADRIARQVAFVGTLVGVVVVGLIVAVLSGFFSDAPTTPQPSPLRPAAPRPSAARPSTARPGTTRQNVAAKSANQDKDALSSADDEPNAGMSAEPEQPVNSPGPSTVEAPRRARLREVDESRATIVDLSATMLASALQSPPSPQVRRAILVNRGIMGERFLLCQSMRYSEFISLVRVWGRQGWRPLRIRPYKAGGQVLVAAVWTRDARPWRFVAGITGDAFVQAVERLGNAGFEPMDAAGFVDAELRFAGVWVKSAGATPQAEVWLARSPTEFKTGLSQLDSTLIAHTRHIFLHNNVYRYSVVWKPRPAGASSADRFGGSRAFFQSRLQAGDRLLDIAVCEGSDSGQMLGASLVRGLTPTTQLYSVTAGEHLLRSRQLTTQGLRPISISVADVGNGQTAAASVWEPLPADGRGSPPMVAASGSPPSTPPAPSAPLPRPTAPFMGVGSSLPKNAEPVERLPVPSKEQRQQASAKVKEVFSKEFEDTATAATKVTLATKLLEHAGDRQDPASRFGLLYEARQLAIGALDIHLALRVTDQLSERFKVNSWQLKADTMARLSAEVTAVGDRRSLLQLVMEMANDAAADDEFSQARKLVDLTGKLNRPRVRELAIEALDLGKRIDEGMKRLEEAERARLELADSPEDLQANQIYGEYLCFSKGDWAQGLKHLAAGSDELLVEIAAKDLTNPPSATDRLALADRWFEAAENRSGTARDSVLLRAKHWYNQALPNLQDLDRTKADLRLEEIASQVTEDSRFSSKAAWLDVPVGEVKRLTGHTSAVTSLVVLRSGTHVISGSRDQTIRVWNLAEGKQTGLVKSTIGSIRALGLSPDDKFLFVAGDKSTVEVWNLATDKLADRVDAESTPRDMVLARDANWLVLSRGNRDTDNIGIFAIRGGPVGSLNCPTYPTSLAVSDSGKLVAAGSRGGNLNLWSLRPAKMASPFTGLGDDPRGVAISPDEKLVAACSYNQAMVWRINSGEMLARMQITGRCEEIAFSRDSRRVLTSGYSNRLEIWDAEDGGRIDSLVSQSGSSGGILVGAAKIACLPDSRGAVTAGSDDIIRVWRLPD